MEWFVWLRGFGYAIALSALTMWLSQPATKITVETPSVKGTHVMVTEFPHARYKALPEVVSEKPYSSVLHQVSQRVRLKGGESGVRITVVVESSRHSGQWI